MTRSLVFALLLATPAVLPASPPPAPPKLMVVIAVDQLSSDLFEEYRRHFTGGLARLGHGQVFARGYQAHGATETCPGHATILTGMHPARSGVVANYWYDRDAPREDKRIYCAEDPRIPGTRSADYRISAYHLKVPALGDHLRHADPASRTVAISGKDRAAVMLGGLAPDQRWSWSTDRWVETRGAAPSRAGVRANTAAAAAIAQAREDRPVPPLCEARARAVTLPGGRIVGTHRFARDAGAALAFRNGPELDEATLDLAADLAGELALGGGTATDLLAVSLAATDYVGHTYGNGGVETCIQLLALDAALGRFLDRLDDRGSSYAVVLTSDHGGLDIPERGDPDGARLDSNATPAAIGARIAAETGLPGPIFAEGVGTTEWHLTPTVPATRRAEILARARALLAAHPQVEAVFDAAELAAHPIPTGRPDQWSIKDRSRASFDAARGGDLLVAFRARTTPIPTPGPTYAATHGSVWDYDRQVPILFWWPGIAPAERSEPAMTVDILPTLAPLLGLSLALSLDGACLPLPGTTCPDRHETDMAP